MPTSSHVVSEASDLARIRRALLDFYRARARELPWRRDRDPYRIWVSEVMLQQTRVETAVPYYERWLERFPTLGSLADAPIDDVLREWAGLGYYRRARNLHRAARVVRERHGGRLPSDPAALRALPGIGDYTAGAIASIAFGRPEPAVDGNVRRVLSRLFDLPEPGAAELRRIAAALVPEERPGEFNQALMEFGSTHCTPRSPACDGCPLAAHCRARAAGTQLERPLPKRARPVPEVDVATVVLVDPEGRVLLRRRPEEGLLGGMWEFPGTRIEADTARRPGGSQAATPGDGPGDDAARASLGAALEGAARRSARGLLAGAPDTPMEPGPPTALGTVVHTFSHLRARYHAFLFAVWMEAGRVQVDGGASGPGARLDAPDARLRTDTRWVPRAELEDTALPAAQRRIAALAFGG